MSTIRWATAWNEPMARPNWVRTARIDATVELMLHLAHVDDERAQDLALHHMVEDEEPAADPTDDLGGGHPAVVEEQLAERCLQPHLGDGAADVEARRVPLDEEGGDAERAAVGMVLA